MVKKLTSLKFNKVEKFVNADFELGGYLTLVFDWLDSTELFRLLSSLRTLVKAVWGFEGGTLDFRLLGE